MYFTSYSFLQAPTSIYRDLCYIFSTAQEHPPAVTILVKRRVQGSERRENWEEEEILARVKAECVRGRMRRERLRVIRSVGGCGWWSDEEDLIIQFAAHSEYKTSSKLKPTLLNSISMSS